MRTPGRAEKDMSRKMIRCVCTAKDMQRNALPARPVFGGWGPVQSAPPVKKERSVWARIFQQPDENMEQTEAAPEAALQAAEAWPDNAVFPVDSEEPQAPPDTAAECEPPEREPMPDDDRGLLYFRKWWFLNDAAISVGGKLLCGIPICLHDETLRMVDASYSYFIPMRHVEYIRTPHGLSDYRIGE